MIDKASSSIESNQIAFNLIFGKLPCENVDTAIIASLVVLWLARWFEHSVEAGWKEDWRRRWRPLKVIPKWNYLCNLSDEYATIMHSIIHLIIM